MFRPHMGHHEATLSIWGDHYTVHFVLSAFRHIVVAVVVVVVVNFLCMTFSSYLFSSRFSVLFSVSLCVFSGVCFLELKTCQ
jgi:hypothetical protein